MGMRCTAIRHVDVARQLYIRLRHNQNPNILVAAYTAERLGIGTLALQLLPIAREIIFLTAPALCKFEEILPIIERIL